MFPAGKGLKRQQKGIIPGAENERDAKGHAHHARGGGKEGGRRFDALWRCQGGQPAQQEGELLQHKAGFGVDILVREYRCSGGTDTANPAAGNRCSGTEIPHLIDCYLRVHSLKAGSNPYTSRIDR